jgi:tetratricopeptide (TPR) repeat protein
VHVPGPVSETASSPSTALSVDPTFAAEVPPHLWLRSGRPMVGTATRVYLSLVLIATALIFVPQGPAYWGLIGGGVLTYFLFPVVVQGLLKPIERRVLAVRRREATALLQEVRGRRLVRQFAPHAWLTLQEGRLHLRRGDGKAAARSFTETVRLSRGAGEPALVSAQAQALLIAEQPEQTRELLQALAKKGPLSASDRLHLGLALLAGKGSGRDALEHVQAAAQTLGGHPRVLAALALALHRADETSEALTMLQRAQDALGDEPDPFDEGLVQRGVKLLRTVQKAQQKRERKVEPVARVKDAKVVTTSEPKLDTKAAEDRAKSARRAKKDERRAARRAAKAEKRTQPESAKAKKGKAPKLKPEGKAPKLAVTAVKPGAKLAEVKPVVATTVKVAKPVVVEAKPVVAEVKPVVAEVKPVVAEVKPVVAEVKPVVAEVKPVVAEAKPAVAEVKPVVAEVKPVVAEVKPVVAVVKPAVAEVKPAVVEVKPVVAEVKPAVVEAKPVAAAAEPRLPLTGARPAPPAGTALFGSLGGSQSGLPRGPSASTLPLGGSGVPKSMLGEVTAPAAQALPKSAPIFTPGRPPAPAVASNPIVRPPAAASEPIARPAAPAPTVVRPPMVVSNPIARPPVVASNPIARPPVVASNPIVRPAAATPMPYVAAAPLTVPARPTAPVLPPPPAAVVSPTAPVLPPPPAAVVSPTAPVTTAVGVRPSELAQVLPETDDAWDDMLNALEADGPSSPA